MLRQLEIKGFKCFEDVCLKLKELTLLTGVNSSGKSSVIQAILFLLQQAEMGKSPLNGKYVRLGQFQDVKNAVTNQRAIEIRADFELDGKNIDMNLSLEQEDGILIRNKGLSDVLDVIYLSAERIGVEDVYRQNMLDEERIGQNGEYAFDYLSGQRMNLLREKAFSHPEAGANLGNQVDYWLDYILGYTVTAEQISGTEVVKVSYRQRGGTGRELKPCHVGTGVSYITSVIIAALSCKKGSIFIIENPEIHLHPGAQSRLLEFFSFLASRGLQVIIETHSDHIFNGVRKSIKGSKIDVQNVSIYFFMQDENCLSRPVPIIVDREGGIRNQEKGLFDQFDDDLDELLGL